MSNSQNNLTVTIQQQDVDGVDIFKRVIGVIGYAGVAGEIDTRKAPDTSQHTLDLPTTTVRQILFYNIDDAAIITLVGTPSGGAEATLAKLGPGDIFIYWAPSEASGSGFSSLKYTSDTSSAPFQMFLGG